MTLPLRMRRERVDDALLIRMLVRAAFPEGMRRRRAW